MIETPPISLTFLRERDIARMVVKGLKMKVNNAPTQPVGGPFAWLVQSTTERNPPHGWAVHMFNGQQVSNAVPVWLKGEVDRLREERDALAQTLNKAEAIGEMLAAVVQGAKEDFVRVPYGASHEDVAAINDWHKMAAEALAAWENKA